MNINSLIFLLKKIAEKFSCKNVDSDRSSLQVHFENMDNCFERRSFISKMSFLCVGILAGRGMAVLDGVAGNFATDWVKDLYSSHFPDVEIRSAFVAEANLRRTDHNLDGAIIGVVGKLNPAEEACVRALSALNNGGLIYLPDYEIIHAVAQKNMQGDIDVFVRTLLAAHLVRAGCMKEAFRLISYVDIKLLRNSSKVNFIEQSLSINYTSLSYADALNTSRWGFGDLLRALRDVSCEFDIYISDDPNPIVRMPDNISSAAIEAIAARSVRGFYVVFFSLLYAAAEMKDAKDRCHAGQMIWRTLKQFSAKFERAVWNCGFIAGLQFHRQGEYDQRDRLLSICLGDQDFWGNFKPNNRWGSSLRGTDVIPIAAAHFMRSTPFLIERMRANDYVPSLARLTNLAQEMAPSSLLQSLDTIRKVAEENLSPEGIFLRHGIHQGGFGIFHEPAKVVRSGLLLQ
ncbi:hypothetical protein [Novispirillum itersonii]|uniref:hypothetical protein n=1 Tax=Novispirillum itersonii TaxID=189 RepID=UPI00039F693E|nr:hypothetical protein [Novispirillum itersonii]